MFAMKMSKPFFQQVNDFNFVIGIRSRSVDSKNPLEDLEKRQWRWIYLFRYGSIVGMEFIFATKYFHFPINKCIGGNYKRRHHKSRNKISPKESVAMALCRPAASNPSAQSMFQWNRIWHDIGSFRYGISKVVGARKWKAIIFP